MLRKICYSLAAFGVAVSMASAHAETLHYTNYSILNGQTVHLTDTTSPFQINENVTAGQFTFTNVTGGNVSTLVTFCIDIGDMLQKPGDFSTGSFVTGTFGTKLNALLTNVSPLLGSDHNASAALQVAIWKAEYGSALTVSGNDTVTSLASTYLGNVNSGLWKADPNMQVAKLIGVNGNQDQAYLSRVPEPATFAVLGVGLLGLVAAQRWRRHTVRLVS